MTTQTFGSVWDALEDTPELAENMKARAVLMQALEAYVRELGVSQAEAARQLGVTQPRLNDLLRGKIDKFSLDALVNLVARTGGHVAITVQRAA